MALVFAGLFANVFRLSPLLSDTSELTRVSIGGVTIFVAIADTPVSRAQGLSGTSELPKNRGMLFVFPRDGYYSFWMKDMQYDIDIIWLSESGTIVHTEERVSPDSYPESYSSPLPAKSVLEVPAGFVEQHKLRLGERVTIFS